MDLMEAKFKIRKEKQLEALKAIKLLVGKETISDASGKHFSWVNTEDFSNARYIEDALEAWRWEVEFDDESNDIVGINFSGEKLIAPYVEAGSYIQMQGEDGEMWRWVFDGATVKEVKPKIDWNE
jgi:hypothetical protein